MNIGRFATVVAAICLIAGAGAALARQTDEGVPEPRATATVRTTPEGVFVRYSLSSTVGSLAFADRGVIRDRWTVITPGLALEDGVVLGAESFGAVEIAIAPDAAEVDRVYMGLTRVGDGYVLYGPGLMVQGLETDLILTPQAGETGLPAQAPIRGYAYIGPEVAVTADDGAVVVVGSTTPPALADRLSLDFTRARAFYARHLGGGLPYEPALIISADSPGPMPFRGDVTDSGVISLRFHGDMWRDPPQAALDYLATFVWHETFHLWNSHAVALDDGVTAPWLHEGGAEYGALTAAVSAGLISEERAREKLSGHLTACREAMGNADHDSRRLRSGSPVYDCGVTIQWIADLETRARSAGAQNIFTLWRELLNVARAGGGSYGVTNFRSLLATDSLIVDLLDGPGATRWTAVEAGLAELGVTLENRPDDDALRVAALFHMNAQHCTEGGTGFFTTDGAVKLDTRDVCGPLSGDPDIAAVEGRHPVNEAAAMFQAVQARCAAAAPVRYRAADGRVIEALCTEPLVAPDAYYAAAAPPLAIAD